MLKKPCPRREKPRTSRWRILTKAENDLVIRTCVACGAKRTKGEMLRAGTTQKGVFTVGGRGKQAGRGCYICPNSTCIEAAKEKKSICRALRTEVPESVYDRLAEELDLEEEGSVP